MTKKNKTKKNIIDSNNTKQHKFCFFCLFATFFGIGKIKGCHGTWGSLAIIPVWVIVNFLLIYDLKMFLLFWTVTIFLIFLLGVKASNIYLHKKGNGKTDPGEIVIDEVVGQLIALVIATLYYSYIIGASHPSSALINSHFLTISLIIVVPFAMFRLFDIAKPWIIGDIDKNMKDGLGIVMDDVVAGIFGGLVTIPIIFLFYVFNLI
jgi:phosphatidylglycerophosphatase A